MQKSRICGSVGRYRCEIPFYGIIVIGKMVTGFSIVDGYRQVVITGVEGAGRKSFAALYFPCTELVERKVRVLHHAKEIFVIILLDSCHLQNQAEAEVLEDVQKAVKRWKGRTLRVLLLLNKTDLVCSRHQNRDWVESVMREYAPYVRKIKAKQKQIAAHSSLSVKRMNQMLLTEIDDDDVEELGCLLLKSGHRMPKSVSSLNAKAYLTSHLKTFRMLSGERVVSEFLKKNKKERK